MSKLEELINKLCPNGVEFKTLGELGKFYGGLTGKSKEDFNKGNAKFITYKNVYENLSLKIDVEDRVNIGENEKQRTLEYGDIIFTGSSETSDECGISSVLTQKTEEKLYLNSFCFFLRLNDKNLLNPDFTKHLFRSSNLRYQIGKTASGVTRFNVSKKAMEKVCIPVPPLEVQCEIVRILDNFTLLSAELSAELSARQKQYNFYKDELIKNAKNVKKQKLSEIAEIYDGTHQTPKYTDSGIKFISVENISDIYHSNKYISKEDYDKYKVKPKINDVFMTRIGTIGKCSVCSRQVDLAYYVSLALIRPNSNVLNSYYLKYLIESIIGIKELRKRTLVNAVPIKINKEDIGRILLPIPPLEEQERIVNILEKFDKLCNDLSEGLPAEIEARKKQYEFYRDKLLTFKELK
ncbi:restriction endonuclease subunit S [Campylobacter sp. P091]|uniref:restriction endonuclease subunit S n=1 Tax=Campylobacter sp. P091 TaxID=1895621 RepID=UPI000A33FD03|nr:restriction endonuclease subunit S [Campylobacter sp. P091]